MSWSPGLKRHAVSCRGKGITCHAMARDPRHALKIARAHGLTVTRQGFAVEAPVRRGDNPADIRQPN